MTLDIADEALAQAHISEQELRIELSLLMYEKWVWGMTQATQYCGLTRVAFGDLMLQREIPIQYSVEDLQDDLAAIGQYRGQLKQDSRIAMPV